MSTKPNFRNITLQYGVVLAELYRSRDEPRWLGDLARVTRVDTSTLSTTVLRFEDRGYVGTWLDERQRGNPRKFVTLTRVGEAATYEAVRRFGARLGDLEGLPVIERTGSEADVAQELGILLGLVRDQAGWQTSAVSALVGYTQPWWSKLERGTVRQPDVQKLVVVMRALKVSDETVVRVVELAETLNRLCAERIANAR